MTNWGFLKCSKNECDNTIARLADELRAAGADEVIVEKGCTDRDMPARLKFLLNTASKGDTLVALSANRLCKTSAQLSNLIQAVREKHLRLVIIGKLTVDCRKEQNDPRTQAFLRMAAAFYEIEDALAQAKIRREEAFRDPFLRGVGRPHTTTANIPSKFYKYYHMQQTGKMNISELARVCGLSRPTVYKYIKLLQDAEKTKGV